MKVHFNGLNFQLLAKKVAGIILEERMRRLFWLALILGGYVWVVTSGREEALFRKGKAVYRYLERWLADAEPDFQLEVPVEKWKERQEEAPKKKHRRWD